MIAHDRTRLIDLLAFAFLNLSPNFGVFCFRRSVLKKNDTVTLDITAMSAEGSGIGRVDDTVVFVPFSAVGDRVEALIVKVKKSFCFGKLIRIISPSKDRVDPDCPVFSTCGGCAFRHISYEAELEIKRRRVEDCVRRIGGLAAKVHNVCSDGRTDSYRNKSQYPVGRDEFGALSGFYALHSHRIIECERCRLLPKEFDVIRKCVLDFMKKAKIAPYDEQTGRGVMRHIYLRKSAHTGQIMVCAVINADGLSDEQGLVEAVAAADNSVSTVLLNINKERSNVILGGETRTIFGSGYITDRLCGMDFQIAAGSFFQVNRNMAQLLYEKARSLCEPSGKTVLDLYCGAGTIGLTMAESAKRVIGVEIVPQAVEDAVKNAEQNGIDNAEFICGSAPDAAAALLERGIKADAVIVDPPRKGLTPELIDTIASGFAPERIVYISCDPATLARDLKQFSSLGYSADDVYPFDLFPRTSHVETVCLLSKLHEAKHHINVKVDMDELELTSAEAKATYKEIEEWVQEHYGFHVTNLNIAQVKQKHGIIERENYNKPKSENNRQPGCPEEKVKAIEDALRHFQMI